MIGIEYRKSCEEDILYLIYYILFVFLFVCLFVIDVDDGNTTMDYLKQVILINLFGKY